MFLQIQLLTVIFLVVTEAKQKCGWPGRPAHGRLVMKREGFMLSPAPPSSNHALGDQVVYSCPALGHSLIGAKTRTCGEGGAWHPALPRCGHNLATNRSSVQSSTLGSDAAEKAVDGDKQTCARTQRTAAQRWWQIKLDEKVKVKTVKLHLKKEPLLALTIFTIELLPNNRTLYKPCGRYNNSYHTRSPRVGRNFLPTLVVTDESIDQWERATDNHDKEEIDKEEIEKHKEDLTVEVHCDNDDTSGHYVFVRDDRKKNEYFTLCEVEVFSIEQKTDDDCGDPELPSGAMTRVSAGKAGGEASHLTIACKDGYSMRSGNEVVDSVHVVCDSGFWNSSDIICEAITCPVIEPIPNGKIVVENDKNDLPAKTKVQCALGFVIWGQANLNCENGQWSSGPPSCNPLTCGSPPRVVHASSRLKNGSTLWKDVAVYSCDPGFLLVVNASTDPVAQDHVSITCEQDGEWDSQAMFTCVNATQLGGAWFGSAHLSINIIYCLLALLIALSIPLLFLHCCGKKLCKRRNKKDPLQNMIWCQSNDRGSSSAYDDLTMADNGSMIRGQEIDTNSCIQGTRPSPKIGIYSVSNGVVIQPATVSPNTLRSLCSTSNTFKPVCFTLPPNSMPYTNWQSTNKRPLPRSSLPFQFDSPMLAVKEPIEKEEPLIDECGYASLIIKKDPLYEPIQEVKEAPIITHHTYDDVPRTSSTHEYANMAMLKGLENETCSNSEQGSTASFPDLLEMVTKSKTPSPLVNTKPGNNQTEHGDNTDVARLYAKVDLSRKRSRPNSDASAETVVPNTKDNLDSYTKTLIDRFNSFLESEGHVDVTK